MVKKEGTRFYEEHRVFATCSPQNPVPRFFIVGWRRWRETSTCTWPLLRQADKLPSLLSDSRRGKLY